MQRRVLLGELLIELQRAVVCLRKDLLDRGPFQRVIFQKFVHQLQHARAHFLPQCFHLRGQRRDKIVCDLRCKAHKLVSVRLRQLLDLKVRPLRLGVGFRHRIPELADRWGSAYLRQRAVVKVISDVLQNLVCVRAARVLRAGDRVAACVVNVQNDFAALLADEVAERIHLCLCRHDGEVDAAAFRGNADVALLHEAHHAARVVSAAVVVPERVRDVSVVDAAVSAGATLMPPGEVQPRAVQQHIARLAPLVRPPKVGERGLVILPRRRGAAIRRKFFLTFLLRIAYTDIRRVDVGGIVAVNPGSESPGGVVSSFFQRKCVYKISILALHDVQIEVIHAISRRLLLVNVVDCIYEIMPAFASVMSTRFLNAAFTGIIGRFTCDLPDIIRKVQRNKALRPCPSAIAERHLPGEFLTVGFPVKPCRDRTFLAIL